MQQIANEMALPETTFVFPPEAPETDARVRIFTPTRELPMAGSPTIGTVFALAGAGRLRASADKTVLGLGIGPTTVGLEWDQNALRFAWMTQPIPTFGPIVTDSVAVAAAVGVQPCDVAGGNLPVQVASSGVPFLYVPLRSRAAVDAASIERGRLCTLLRGLNLEELPVFVFSCQPADDDATVYSRMFGPCIGIPEDPATGAASGPLGAYLLQHNAVSADNASIELRFAEGSLECGDELAAGASAYACKWQVAGGARNSLGRPLYDFFQKAIPGETDPKGSRAWLWIVPAILLKSQ